MKNLRKSGIALAIACAFLATNFTTLASTGTEGEELVKVTETNNVNYELNRITNSKKVILGIKLLEDEKVRLIIQNKKNEDIFSKWYKTTSGFMQTFDFSKLNDGVYTFKIKAGNEKVENTVEIKDDKAILPGFSAYISEVEDSKVKFSYFAPKDDVYLVLKNKEGEKLFEKKVGAGYNSSGIANLSKLSKGTYTLQIKNGTNIESKEIKI
ncbi:MAG: hypothetical protein OEW67_01280 [Cyclobacteriaceae bacterium]|nr:hypothetical protein [Cyclobacteriaceae bacterium]